MKPSSAKLVTPISGPQWTTNESAIPALLSFSVENGEIRLSVPASAVVALKESVIWKKLYSGQRLAKEGITGAVHLSLPLQGRYRISLQNKRFYLAVPGPALTLPKFERPSQGFFISLGIHLVLILSLSALSQWIPAASPEMDFEEAGSSAPTEAGASAIAEIPASRSPFEGISYWKYVSMRNNKSLANAASLSDLEKALGQTTSPGVAIAKGNLGAGIGLSDSVLGGTGQGGTGRGAGLRGRLAGRGFAGTTSSSAESGPKFSEKDRQLVERKFRELALELQRVHNQILMREPDFSVRLVFKTEVLSSGNLKLIETSPSGKYSTQSLGTLLSTMKELVSQIFVGKHLSGLVFRGENIFSP